jgi:hypothetical protein
VNRSRPGFFRRLKFWRKKTEEELEAEEEEPQYIFTIHTSGKAASLDDGVVE